MNMLRIATSPAFSSHSMAKKGSGQSKLAISNNESPFQKSNIAYNPSIYRNYSTFIPFKGSIFNPTYDFIKELTNNPRDSLKKQDDIRALLPQNDIYKWKQDVYLNAYSSFTEKFFNEANSIDELIKHRPDWTGNKLRNKFQSLHPGEVFKFGKIPTDFIDKETFNQLLKQIYETVNKQAYKVFSKEYEFNAININGNEFKVKPLTGGASSKIPLLVTTPSQKKYVLKINPDKYPDHVDPIDVADSIILQAIIDYYLTLNNCQNAAKMYYYEKHFNVAVYEYVEKDLDQSQVQGAEKISGNFVRKMKDLKALGITFNDTIGDNNVLVNKGNLVVVDSGHCTFEEFLKPVIWGYHKDLPNNIQSFGF